MITTILMATLVEIKNLTKTYKLGDEVLNALDTIACSIQAGEFIAITDPSGSGKSTLADIIGGLGHPTSGSVVVDGSDLSHTHDRQLSDYLNHHIGFVFQPFNLQGNQTALENIMPPLVFAKMKPKNGKTEQRNALTPLKRYITNNYSSG